MNKSIKLLEKVVNCSRCGLCQEVCPVFKVKKNECSVARGKFLQLLGILRGDLKFSPKIMKNLDLCLCCKKCTTNCPSSIDTVALLSQIRAQKNSPFEKFMNGELVFSLKMLALKALRLFKKQRRVALPEGALYFKGCIKSSVKVNTKSHFKCCALPFLVKGSFDIYEKYIRHNMKIIEDHGGDVYFDCATCFDAVCDYPFKEPQTLGKLRMMGELAQNPSAPVKVTFHKPCHLKGDEIEERLKALPNVEYIPLENADCCGFGGDFFFRHPIIAHTLSVAKARQVLKSGAKIVYSACPTCIWSLKWGLFWECTRINRTSKSLTEKVQKPEVADITALLP